MDNQQITSITGFIEAHKNKHPSSHFFDRDTLKFFGERLSDMRLLKNVENITSVSGNPHICYVISSIQRKMPSGTRRVYHYFDVDTLDHILI